LQIADGDGIHACERLIKEHHPRARDQAARDLDASPFSAGEGSTFGVPELLEVKIREELRTALRSFASRDLTEFHNREEVFANAELPKDRGLLWKVAKSKARPPVHWEVGEVLPVEFDLALIRADSAYDHIEGGGLACAVGPQETVDLSFLDLEGHVIDDDAATELFTKRADL